MWPRQSRVAISDARSDDLTTVPGLGRGSNSEPSDSETNTLSPRPRPHIFLYMRNTRNSKSSSFYSLVARISCFIKAI